MREERLRATAGLRSSPALSSWRGQSGRRYIVGVHPLAASEVGDVADAVILAVARSAAGVARVVAMTTVGTPLDEKDSARFLSRAQRQGATEMHVHRLAYDDRERREIIADLAQTDDTKAAC